MKRTAVWHRSLERAFGKELDRASVVHLDLGELDGFLSARAECDRVHLWETDVAEMQTRMDGKNMEDVETIFVNVHEK